MKYNINELLDLKKNLEAQIQEKRKINAEELKYAEEKYTDYTNSSNNKTNKARNKITLLDFNHSYYGLVDELAKVKSAIQKYNSEQVLSKLHEREATRHKIAFLKDIKTSLPRDVQRARKVIRQGKDGETQEIVEISIEPMFALEEVQQQMDKLAAQERKLNTEIQKLNLNAQIEL